MRCNTASAPRAFCLPNNCSAPPEIAPERPLLLLDCSKTSTINRIDTIISKAETNVCTLTYLLKSFNYLKCITKQVEKREPLTEEMPQTTDQACTLKWPLTSSLLSQLHLHAHYFSSRALLLKCERRIQS